MLRAKSGLLSVLLAALVLPSQIGAAHADDESVLGQDGGSLILVLDASGSMREPAGGGQTRMEAAKKGLHRVIAQVPDDSAVGLRAYGSTVEDGAGSCKDSKLLVRVDDVDKKALNAGVDKLAPLGNTPIAYALGQAYEDLPKDGPRSIVLVSDGQENCGGDPCKVARELKDKGAGFYVDVVGLQVDQKSRDQLTCIASAGGGTYYDVDDIKKLPSTLTRSSVRAARGYEPAGIPIEGGTDAASAAPIEDGQWLDTVGDSGEEFYALPDPGEGTLHLSAAMPPSVKSGTAAEVVELTVLDSGGNQCGSEGREVVQGMTNANAPFTAEVSLTAEEREDCDGGPYVMSVRSPDLTTTQPLEVLVRSEPAVSSTEALPAPFDEDSFSDKATGTPPGGPAQSAIGGSNFSSAPPTAPGVYTDSILTGETLLYRVPDVEWGQQVVCDATFGKAAAAAGALDGQGFRAVAVSRVFGPMKSEIKDFTANDERAWYDGAKPAIAHAASPPVRYRNRELTNKNALATDLSGDYYCGVTLLGASTNVDKKIGEVPVRLAVSVSGSPSGQPSYASDPVETENEKRAEAEDGSDAGSSETSAAAEEDDSSNVLAWAAGGLLLLVVVALGGGFLVWQGRRGDHPTP